MEALRVLLLVSHVMTAVTFNLYQAHEPLSSDSADVSVSSRSKRDAERHTMADFYDIIIGVNGTETKTRLTRQDVVGDLHTTDENGRIIPETGDSIYKRDWASYTSEELDGVFLVSRHPHNGSRITVEGHMLHNDTPFLIQPSKTGVGHTMHKIGQRLLEQGYEWLDRSVLTERRRSPTETYYIHINVYMDRPLQELIIPMFVNPKDRVRYLRQHYLTLITWVDRRLQTLKTRTRCLGDNLFILKDSIPEPSHSEHLSTSRSTSKRLTACHDITIKSFLSYIEHKKSPQHSMLITGYDMIYIGGGVNGISYKGKLCLPKSVSAISFRQSLVMMQTATHELGHCMGAGHDGIDNECKDDEFMMASDGDDWFNNAATNWWKYSDCSLKEIDDFMKKIGNKTECLLHKKSRKIERSYYGSTMTHDQQCQLFAGDTSYSLQPIGSKPESVCTYGLTCVAARGGKSKDVQFIPYDGTPCGVRKWCDGQDCVKRPRWWRRS